MERRFILGVGAQKAGTTWLCEYLKSYDCVKYGPLKEHHVWDALYIPDFAGFRTMRSARPMQSKKKALRARMQRNPKFYFNYFARLLAPVEDGIAFDITPSYSGLKRDVLKMISDEFTARQIDCRVVFLMRDPVERCLSAMKMSAHNKNETVDVSNTSELLLRAIASGSQLRTRYHDTLTELDNSIHPAKLYVGIYEEMFTAENISKISDFIGVDARHEFADKTFNASTAKVEFGEELKEQIALHYSDVYQAVKERMPQVASLWPGFKYL